jgi:hypothetical protein
MILLFVSGLGDKIISELGAMMGSALKGQPSMKVCLIENRVVAKLDGFFFLKYEISTGTKVNFISRNFVLKLRNFTIKLSRN